MGTRLRSVVSDLPKCMAPVAGRPFLAWLLDDLLEAGFEHIILSLGYLPRTLAVTALNVLPFALLYCSLYLFLYVGFIWIFLYFSAAAYLNAKTLEKVFAPYREPREEEKT